MIASLALGALKATFKRERRTDKNNHE